MNKPDISIFCIEDDRDTGELIKFVFAGAGYQVTACGDYRCLETVEMKMFSAVILNSHFGSRSGIEICREIRSNHPQIPIIFFSGEVRPAEINKAMEAGASVYLTKPNDFENLVETTFRLIENSQI